MARGVRQGCLFTMALTLSFDGSTTRSSQDILPIQTFFNILRVPMLMILRLLLRPSGR